MEKRRARQENKNWEERICAAGYGTYESGVFKFRTLDSVVIHASFPPSIHLLTPGPGQQLEVDPKHVETILRAGKKKEVVE